MTGRGGELNAKRMKQLQHRIVARLRTRFKCFVKALAPETGIPSELRHAARTRHVAHCGQEHVGIGVFQCSSYVLRNGFVIISLKITAFWSFTIWVTTLRV